MNLLIVDDSAVMRKLVRRGLRQAGFKDIDVVEAEDCAVPKDCAAPKDCDVPRDCAEPKDCTASNETKESTVVSTPRMPSPPMPCKAASTSRRNCPNSMRHSVFPSPLPETS